MALLQRIQDGNHLESSANTDYNKSSEYFVFQLFIENLILITWPHFSGGISGNVDICTPSAREIFHPTQWALLN